MQQLTPTGFHTLSEQNSRLNQNLIQVTLSHQSLVQENTKLTEELKKKDYTLIETTLRQKNANHMLEGVRKEYEKLQNEYKELFDWMRSEKKVEMRELFKRESQLAIDMAFIEGESYREGQKAKNEQIAKYQERLITLVKQNQDLKTQILQTTSQYNSKLYLQQQLITQQELIIKSLQSKLSLGKPMPPPITLPTLQLQLQLQNTRQKLQLYMKENEAIGKMNLRLREENDSLFKELKEVKNAKKEVEDEDENETIERVSVDVMMGLRRENDKLRKEIEEVSNKYQMLAETFPGLVEDQQALLELQQNMQTQAQAKKLTQQLKQSTLKCQSLQASLSHLEQKLLAQTKTRQESQHKTSLLVKRFNEMFIRMNPYFDIYKYDMLEFDEKQFEFFDKNKDYKQLKEYEALVGRLKREIKEHQLKAEFKERDLSEIIREKDNTLERLEKELEQTTLKLNELTQANNLLQSSINQNQLLEQELANRPSDQLLYQKSLQNQVTVPLMQQLILQLQQQRQQLFQTIFAKDNEIASLLTKLQESTVTVQPVVLPEVRPQTTVGSLQVNEHIAQLVRQNEEQEKRFNERIEELRRVVQEYQVKLNHQHDFYRLEVMQYENDYEKKLAQLNQRVLTWTNNCESLKQLLLQKELNQAPIVQHDHSQQPNPIQEQPHQQGQIPIARHPSQSHLEHIPIQTSEPTSSNNLIGESTVQNLTAIIKKYEQQMNEVLSMCAKLSQEYSELKSKLKDHQLLERNIQALNDKVHTLSEEIRLKDKTIQEKNNSLKTIEQLYSTKEIHCEELKKQINVQSKLMETSVHEQKQRNELLTKQLSQIKERFYQLVSKPSQEQNQNAIMNKSEFQTIVVMHANKNKEISQLAEKNKLLENKVEILMKELNLMKLHSFDKKPQDLSPLEKVEMKQLTSLLQETNIFELIKQANSIIEKEKQKSVEKQEKMIQEPNQEQ